MPRAKNGSSTKIGVIWQKSDFWAKNRNFGPKVTINNHQLLTHLLARPTDSHLDRGGGELDSQFPRRARLPTDAAADGALGLHGLHRHPALLHRLRRRRRAGDQGQDD